ncbi:C2 family cysteine protease [Cellulomonas dongxiuzhuiae]|uniref:Calpain catalytic domain-containing protein n=1 Tax=Cellulomonas dongxiuzhuiae TaxID=2819979 RepID=A0ABX8GGL1_9CELL|nr:C2 family cysteine protease [Cellulomonas dongxiuzhuiae]MBO3088451.1 hypothetical protein [Cellulomonas dongxiuzhuiae]MBO3094218.1 hypothetical protein [Cellulomonas dongxiuzhuiae]QWC15269.1 hypothetical protein KKR89_13210 [Cellulomonas dongxiuzhuiae]
MATLRTRARAHETSDRGAGSVEYLGVVIVVVIIVAGVIAAARVSDVGTTLAERVTCAVRSIGTQAGDCGGEDTPTYYGGDDTAPPPVAEGEDGAATGPDRAEEPAAPTTADTGATGGGPDFVNADDTRPAADQERVDEALDDVRDALDGGFWGVRSGDLADAREAVEQLNGREIDALVAAMSDDELEHWVDQMEDGWAFSGWSRDERRELWELMAGQASKETLDRLAGFTDELQPSFSTVGGDDAQAEPDSPANAGVYGEVPHDLFVQGVDPNDVDQGSIGNCWWMASLGAVAQADPGVIEGAITSNANGSYTVRLYDDGSPVHVTVTPEMVLVDGAPALARSPQYLLGDDRTTGYELWPLVMEKALALHYGDYEKTEGGTADVGLEILTGVPSTNHDPGGLSIDELAGIIEDGGAIGLSAMAKGEGTGLSTYQAQAGTDMLHRGHAYYVSAVDTKKGTVTVVNPWGTASYPPITMTIEDFDASFRQVRVNEVHP